MAKRAQQRQPLPRLDTLLVDQLVALRRKHPEENARICEQIYRNEVMSIRGDQGQERLAALRDSRDRLASLFSSYKNAEWIVKHKDLARVCRTTLLATEKKVVLRHWVRNGLLTQAAVDEQFPEDVPTSKGASKNGRHK